MLRKLARGAPNASQFVVSQFGSVPTYAGSLTRTERASQAGTGPCDFRTPTGDIAREKVARLERAIHAYEDALEAACDKVSQCTYDGGAFGRIVDRREYLSSDLNHCSIEGHAKAAAVAWAAIRRRPRRSPHSLTYEGGERLPRSPPGTLAPLGSAADHALTSILGQIVVLRFQRGGKRNRSWRPSSQGIGVVWSARPASIRTGW
jgi:hypothetical protein